MKVKYFYDGQVRRVLRHLIRLFGEFQVSAGFDQDGNQKLRSVPCRYADISRMTAYELAGGSENSLQTLPIITINIQSLNIDRPNIGAPVSSNSIMGTNKTPETNVYTNELDEIHKVTRFNPVPWDLVFNVNICTTTTTAKLELYEQICSLFNPSVQLQLNDNPMDWASTSNVELTDCVFSTRGFPQGQDSSDLDVMVLTFKTTLWLSLPATVQRAKLVQQIVTNIKSGRDDMDIDFKSLDDVAVLVFTPRNMGISVKRLSKNSSIETYELTLTSKNMSTTNDDNNVYSWDLYMKYLNPNYDNTIIGIKLLDEIEDLDPINAEVISKNVNKMIVSVDSSKLRVTNNIRGFVTKEYNFKLSTPTDIYINSGSQFTLFNKTIPENYMFSIDNSEVILINPEKITEYVYNQEDMLLYKYDVLLGWHQSVYSNYRPGYWKITFKE